MNELSIIMYHYVRDLENSRYPGVKGLSTDQFRSQLKYIQMHYHVIDMEDLIEFMKSRQKLPDNALLLTFDDGYIDHYENVFPILDDLGIQGSFFPVARVIEEKIVLDVNKIHFILASADEKDIIRDIYNILDEKRDKYSLKPNQWYYDKYAIKWKYDSSELSFIKKLLQKGLPSEPKKQIIDYLFQKYVGVNEKVFSREIYMNMGQLKCMKRHGMYIGGHGFNHVRLDYLKPKEQELEINKTLDLLKKVGTNTNHWTICYPHGSYNQSLIKLLQANGCRVGIGTKVGIANLFEDSPYALPRLNTNDLPK